MMIKKKEKLARRMMIKSGFVHLTEHLLIVIVEAVVVVDDVLDPEIEAAADEVVDEEVLLEHVIEVQLTHHDDLHIMIIDEETEVEIDIEAGIAEDDPVQGTVSEVLDPRLIKRNYWPLPRKMQSNYSVVII